MTKCPICNRPTDAAYRPFCSRRCADVDLGRWFNGTYRVPSFRTDDDPEADPGGRPADSNEKTAPPG